MRADILALPFLLLAAAGSSNHKLNNKRSHRRIAEKSLEREQQRDQAITEFNHNATLTKRQSFTGRGTFYYTGLGACGQYSKDSDYMVALNSAQYCCGYPGPQCFKTITVQANGVTVGGVQIMDECPTCDHGGLDLSPALFRRFADEGAGVIQVNWWFEGSAPQPAPSTTQHVEPTSTWTPPSSTWTPPSSTWSPSPPPTSTWTPPTSAAAPTSTWTPPPSSSSTTSSSTSIWVAPSSSSSSSSSSPSVNATINPFAVVQSYNGTSASSTSYSASATASTTASIQVGGGNAAGAGQIQVQGHNLEALNGLVANYGQLIVVGAGGLA